jgi:hypothetical protein
MRAGKKFAMKAVVSKAKTNQKGGYKLWGMKFI